MKFPSDFFHGQGLPDMAADVGGHIVCQKLIHCLCKIFVGNGLSILFRDFPEDVDDDLFQIIADQLLGSYRGILIGGKMHSAPLLVLRLKGQLQLVKHLLKQALLPGGDRKNAVA